MNDKDNSIKQLNQLSTKLTDKHKKYLTLLRYVVYEYFDMSKEAESELKQFKSKEPALHDSLFTKGKSLEFEMFSVQHKRLCNQFKAVKFPPESTPRNKLNGAVLLLRPSFSMPFIKPPNMIPCVDETAIQLEFNLKQIDAPMPEAPWINRCPHGTVIFTEDIPNSEQALDKQLEDDREQLTIKPQDITQIKGLISVKARLLENYVGGNGAKGDGEDKLSLADEDENQGGLTIADYLKDQKCS